VSLDASSSEAPAGSIESYEWEIEEATGTESASFETTSHSWSERGEYEVTLTVTDNGGATDSVTENIQVGDGASVEERSQSDAGEETGTDGTEGTGEDGERPTIDFDELLDPGNIETEDQDPTAEFEYSPTNPGPKDRVVFDPSASEAPGSQIVTHRWFINGELAHTGKEFSANFEDSDVYVVELEIENQEGNTDRTTETIPVGDKEDRIDNPEFTLDRSTPEDKQIYINRGESVPFSAEIAAAETPVATKSFFVDGALISQSEVDSKTLRSTYKFDEYGEHTAEIEVKGIAGKSDTVQWEVTTHPFNAIPTTSEQSSTKRLDTESATEILTFSIQNPSVNEKDIFAELVTQAPDGISIAGTSGASTTSSAIQTAQKTVSPGSQQSMRLSINVDDDSLQGKSIRIPYQVRYYPEDNDKTVYTDDEQSMEVLVGEDVDEDDENKDGENEDNQDGTVVTIPGFGVITTLFTFIVTILLVAFVNKS
jgi:hypothetical protein